LSWPISSQVPDIQQQRLRKPRETLVRIGDNPAEIRTGYLANTRPTQSFYLLPNRCHVQTTILSQLHPPPLLTPPLPKIHLYVIPPSPSRVYKMDVLQEISLPKSRMHFLSLSSYSHVQPNRNVSRVHFHHDRPTK